MTDVHAASEETRTFDRAAEVEALLERDETVLGRLWQYQQQGMTTAEMKRAEGNYSYNGLLLIRVLRDGEVPTAPSLAQAAARKVRAWIKNPEVSDELRAALTEQETLIVSRAEDSVAQAEESERAAEASKKAEASGVSGIYVYTLPHYLRHPYDAATGRTLLKVGHSSVDAHYRVSSQGRLTALPEDPILLRIYPVDASADAEKKFHVWLRDADHAASRTRRGGAEWFVTSTKFLDRVADSLGLEVMVINDLDADEL